MVESTPTPKGRVMAWQNHRANGNTVMVATGMANLGFSMVAIGEFLSWGADFDEEGILRFSEPVALEETTEPERRYEVLDELGLLKAVLSVFGLMNEWGEDMAAYLSLSENELQKERDDLMSAIRLKVWRSEHDTE